MATLSFWGGVGTVTGSRYLIETRHSRVLVDCGLFQGQRELRERNWQEPPFDPRSLDAVILTHAHIDHTGYLPRFVKQGFKGPVYCSRGTAELCKILLPDAARLQEEEADYRNRHNLTRHSPALPLYTEEDAKEALALLRPLTNRDETLKVTSDLTAHFFNAGHLLGSRFVLLKIAGAGDDKAGRSVLFSGDLGNWNRPILRDPATPPACDYLLVESTYGDRLHDPEDPKEALARILNEAAGRDAPILIPAFSIGRTQDLLYIIRELEDAGRIPIMPVGVDSPMASEATRVYARLFEEHDAEYAAVEQTHRAPLRTRNMMLASSREESKRLNAQTGARIILSAAGMMTGGRVLHHAQRVLPNPNATLLFVGYQGAGTLGRRILDGEKEVKIFKQWFPVNCHVARIQGFSGHPDWKGVMHWLEGIPNSPRRTFITHGEPEAALAMQARIQERFGWKVTIPQYSDSVELE